MISFRDGRGKPGDTRRTRKPRGHPLRHRRPQVRPRGKRRILWADCFQNGLNELIVCGHFGTRCHPREVRLFV